MRRMGAAAVGLMIFLVQGDFACAQDTVDALEKDLQDIKQTHQDMTSQAIANFFSQLETASQSPEAALDLYEKAGGAIPQGAPVQTSYAHETPHEKEAREAQDAAMLGNLANVAELHCGLMKYAALLITSPDQKGLHAEWLAWLKNATQIFLQLKDDGFPQTRDLRKKAVKDSLISGYLGFTSWGDKDPGNWNVNGFPGLYRSEILEPLRNPLVADALPAWDVYISLKASTQPDQDKWNQVESPSLMFDRGCDDYALSPSMDKLQVLHDLLKANPTHPKFDDMLARMHTLIQDYKARHPGAATPQSPAATASTPASGDSSVKVTTTTEGDMTIITTQTNAAGTTPPAAPPTPPVTN